MQRQRRGAFGSQTQLLAFGEIDQHPSPRLHLLVRHERRERLGEHPVNRPLQFAGTVFPACAFPDQQLTRGLADLDLERPLAEASVHVPLELANMMIEDFGKRVGVQ